MVVTMTEPYLEILDHNRILRVNTTCPFSDMMNPGSYVYLPNAVDIPAGDIKDGMVMIPLDPNHMVTLNVSFPIDTPTTVRLPYYYLAEANRYLNYKGGAIKNKEGYVNTNDKTQHYTEGVFARVSNEYTSNFYNERVITHSSDADFVYFTYFLEGQRTYQIGYSGTNFSNYTFNIVGNELEVYGPDDYLIGIIAHNKLGDTGDYTFTAPRTGFYRVKLYNPFGNNFGTESLIISFRLNYIKCLEQQDNDPWGKMQYVKGNGHYDATSGTGNFSLSINDYPFIDEEPSFESKIGYLWLYPTRFDNFIQYQEGSSNGDI